MKIPALVAVLFASVAFAQSTYSVELQAIGPNKISVIKVVKDSTGLGLKDSKELVEAAPKQVKAGLDQAAADALAANLRAAGATAAVLAADGKVQAAPAAPAKAAAEPGAGLSTVTLTACGPNKIQMIKIVREVTGLGLKEAKTLVEKTPAVVKKGLSAADAEELVNKLQFAGGTAKIAPDAP